MASSKQFFHLRVTQLELLGPVVTIDAVSFVFDRGNEN